MIGFFKRVAEDRHRRAARRRRTEEIMGWICVPVIIGICWFGWKAWDQLLADRPQIRELVVPSTTAVQRK